MDNLSIMKGLKVSYENKRLHKIFEDYVEMNKNKTAVIFKQKNEDERFLTFDSLNRKANQIAGFIIETVRNAKASANDDGDFVVGVCMTPSDSMILTLLAIWKSGAAYLPIDPNFPLTRINHMINECKPVMTIYDQSANKTYFEDILSKSYTDVVSGSKEFSDMNISNAIMLQSSKDVAVIFYTSGSTGTPKGVRYTHSIALNRLHWQWNTFPFASSERSSIFKITFTFADSVPELFGSLLKGLTVIVTSKADLVNLEHLINTIDKYKIERIMVVPSQLRSILLHLSMQKRSKKLLRNLKLCISTSETFSVALATEFFDYFTDKKIILCNFYGSTEVSGDVTYFVCNGKSDLGNFKDKLPIGYPIFQSNIYIVDDELRVVPVGQQGEIVVAGLSVAPGYVNGYNDDGFVENLFVDDVNDDDAEFKRLYRTGDFGSMKEDGFIHFDGRNDTQIKVRGYRVNLIEIESSISSINGIFDAVALCYHPGEDDQALVAFVTLMDNSIFKFGVQVENILKMKLTDYMMPKIIILKEFPTISNGKLDRQRLIQLYENNCQSKDDFGLDFQGVPFSHQGIAKDLFETIRQVVDPLSRTTISLFTNFYEIGGNSLNTILTLSRLRHKGYSINLADFLKARNLRDILEKMSLGMNSKMSFHVKNVGMGKFKTVPLQMYHKNEAIRVITSSFYEKGNLENWIKPKITHNDHIEFMESIWSDIIISNLSFGVFDQSHRIVGVSINFNIHNSPKPELNNNFKIILDFLDFIEKPIIESNFSEKPYKVLQSFLMGTSTEMNTQENIRIMNLMEVEVQKIAKKRQFTGIFTTNVNPLTQQLQTDVYNYEILLDYQLNEYMDENACKPFENAPDSERAIIQWKKILND